MLVKKTIGNTEFTFINRSESTRHGFKHVCELYKEDYKINTAVCHYINRTWECYQYQTVMCKTVGELIYDREELLLSNYKVQNDIKRMTANKRAEFEKSLESDDLMNVYKELRATL